MKFLKFFLKFFSTYLLVVASMPFAVFFAIMRMAWFIGDEIVDWAHEDD
jgi:hypothetical protein